MWRLIRIIAWVFLFAGLFVLLGFVYVDYEKHYFSDISVNIDYSDGNFFVEEEDVVNLIGLNSSQIKKYKVAELSVAHFEKELNAHPAIESAHVFISIDKVLNILVKQRKPILRVMNNNKESYYIDANGKYMPLSEKFTSRVIVVNGNQDIPPDYRLENKNENKSYQHDKVNNETQTLFNDSYKLAIFITNHRLWNSLIEQIYINNGEYELIPKVGTQRIILGDLNNLEEKFNNMRLFYKDGVMKTDWNQYAEINLKYNNQVVCKKK